MKKLIISILILLCVNIKAQEYVVILPVDIAKKVLIDLVHKDNLEYRISIKDSIIFVYEKRIEKFDSLLSFYKLNEIDYKRVIENKDLTINLYKEKELAYKEKEKIYQRKIKNGKVREKIGFGAVILGIILSLISN